MICRRCRKEFEPRKYGQVYCCGDCYYLAAKERNSIKSRIRVIAKNNNFEIRNLDKIVRLKMSMFWDGDKRKCPCASGNKEKYCGSEACINETKEKGHCHCGLFYKKDSTNE